MKKFSLFLIAALVGLILLTSCRPPELEGAFVDYNAGRHDSALKLAEIAVQKYPQNGEAWFLVGRIYGKKERFSEMVHAFDKAVALNKQYEKEANNEKTYYFQTSFNKGVTRYNAFTNVEDRESEKALKIINQAISSFKDANTIKTDYKTTALIATSYNISARTDTAFIYFTELTKINPDTTDSWLAVSNYYFHNKNYEKSIDNLKTALELDPNNVEANTLISQAYDMLGDTENALKAYEKAKELNKEEKAFPYNLGLIYNKLLNTEGIDEALKVDYLNKVVENFSLVIDLDPEIQVPYQMKAYGEIQLKKYEDAVGTLMTGIDHFAEDGSLWFNLGIAYTHLEKKKEAEDAFAKAEELGYGNK